MYDKKISKANYVIYAVIGLLIFLFIWFFLSNSGLVKNFFLPTPMQVLLAIKSLLLEGSLLTDIFASVYRILLGFLLSLIISLPLGIALGVSRKFEAFTEPLIAFIRYIPPSAFIPLAIIWFGIGEMEKVVILFLGVAPYLTLLIADIVISTRRELVEAALTLGATSKDIITKVVFPNALPGIWDSFRIMI